MTTATVPSMKSISFFREKVKDGIIEITGTNSPVCPICGKPMKSHGRCKRYLRISGEKRVTLSVRVFYCPECRRYHRELPDYITPYKHLSTDMIAEIYDGTDNYDVDDSTIIRVRKWVRKFLSFGAATVRRLKLEHPALEIRNSFESTSDTLTYFVRMVVNSNEWKFISSPVISV